MSTSKLQPVRLDYRVGGPGWGARDAGTVSRRVGLARGEGGVSVREGPDGGLVISVDEDLLPNRYWAFGYAQSGARGERVTIYPGKIVLHGLGVYDVPLTAITLSCAPTCWVYVEAPQSDFFAGAVRQAAAFPQTDATALRLVLYRFNCNVTTARYGRPIVQHAGNFDFHSPST